MGFLNIIKKIHLKIGEISMFIKGTVCDTITNDTAIVCCRADLHCSTCANCKKCFRQVTASNTANAKTGDFVLIKSEKIYPLILAKLLYIIPFLILLLTDILYCQVPAKNIIYTYSLILFAANILLCKKIKSIITKKFCNKFTIVKIYQNNSLKK